MSAAVVAWAFVMLGSAARGRGYDLAPLAAAGHLVATNQAAHLYAQDPRFYNLVNDPVFRQASVQSGFAYEPTPFVYPPLVAWLMSGVARIPFAILANAWAALSTMFVLLGLYLTLTLYLRPWRRPTVWAALLLALCMYEPLRYGFWLGQTTAIIFPLVIGALTLQRRERFAGAGLALAVATFIKLTPIVLAAIWLWRGPRRAALWVAAWLAALWAVSLAVLGIDVHRAYLERLTIIGRAAIVAFNNHSLLAFVSRYWFERDAWYDWRMHAAPRSALILTTALLVAGGIAAYVRLRTIPVDAPDRWRPCAEGFAMLGMLLAPNIAWTHYFVFLLPVSAIALGQRRSAASWLITGGTFLLCCRPFLPRQDIAPSTAGTALALSGPILAAGVLYLVLLWVASPTRVGPERA